MKKSILSLMALAAASGAYARQVMLMPMEVYNNKITETVSGRTYDVQGLFTAENTVGAKGNALRFDGYTTQINADLPALDITRNMTVALWVAAQTYPIIEMDKETTEKVALASCLDEGAMKGFGFYMGFDGSITFRCYVGSRGILLNSSKKLTLGDWNSLVATVSPDTGTATLYFNGEQVAQTAINGNDIKAGDGLRLKMGYGDVEHWAGPFRLDCFNGAIDELAVYDELLTPSQIAAMSADNEADLAVTPERFAGSKLRPKFHGMPSANWTNESHGMTYSDGKFHVFFQKNGNGPYMSRLHWGHISSPDLCTWTEEKVAIAPGEWYDMKGCWSGCVFSDDVITGGKPNIIYTGVDYARAYICQATPDADDLKNWTKFAAPIVNGRPDGLSDDFRDPYFFRNGDNAYVIVGSSRNGIGTTTLHRYDAASKTWSNRAGDLFFSGANSAQDGTFWEMPNVTRMADGRWLFTVTPLNTATGVHTIYYVGNIDGDGKFIPTSYSPKDVELISRDGYGLLSPTIYQHDGKTIALGIVPDKLPGEENYRLGWAHLYSMPREWSLDSDGNLIQKPYSGLESLRSSTVYSRSDFDLNGIADLTPVSGRQLELLGRFQVGSSPVGFNFFRSGNSYASVKYTPSTNSLTVDLSRLSRISNDGGVYNGVYSCTLPTALPQGSELKLNVFVDGSVLDIFVNDRWATSIRVFPTANDADGVEAFAEGNAKVKELKAWTLEENSSGVPTFPFESENTLSGGTSAYDLYGRMVSANGNLDQLAPGVYIVGGKKVIKR